MYSWRERNVPKPFLYPGQSLSALPCAFHLSNQLLDLFD